MISSFVQLDLVKEPSPYYGFMRRNNIGVREARFWLRWAGYLEDKIGDVTGALERLQEGIDMCDMQTPPASNIHTAGTTLRDYTRALDRQ